MNHVERKYPIILSVLQGVISDVKKFTINRMRGTRDLLWQETFVYTFAFSNSASLSVSELE